ncbi:riboflavin biosynthesis protein RibD, partial [Methylobacterium sp. WL18]|uniref:dihydrofolate reductase family protein n=1 Tax=Methylobacterium sp. WL18 TaxID=2603897 RepID=UPI0011D44E64
TGRVELPTALAHLGERGLTRLCSEGGPRLADALARADLIEACTLVTGPAELGPAGGLKALGPDLTVALASEKFRLAERLQLGPDEAATYERMS